VHAVHDGVVVRAVRDEVAGGIAGRFVILAHKGGEVQTSYIHLREIRTDLRSGTMVRGGEVIGTLGRTGIRRSGHHLHFALAVRQAGRLRYLDPEPLARHWLLPAPTAPSLVAGGARYGDRGSIDPSL
jgi:murein DD-endopeptidase MepM/ murein hydrolase activator NlpD